MKLVVMEAGSGAPSWVQNIVELVSKVLLQTVGGALSSSDSSVKGVDIPGTAGLADVVVR